MTDFSKLLNPEQCAAATAGDGPLLVLAAAGTGKTRTLVHRVACLVERGVPAERILLLTFTNRAAKEMMERAEKLVGPNVATIWSGTFHHVCAKFLRRYGGFLGYKPGFQILDEEDQKKIIGEIIKADFKDADDFPKKDVVAKMISEAANESKPIEAIAARWMTKAAGVDPGSIRKVAERYAARKLELGAMDFDDLLVNGLRLLKERDTVREALQEHFLHILVDEYQDTNSLQSEFTDILAAKHRNLMVVGDDFQCIYTWRGAQIENILNFPKRWPGCKTIKLERNYRSVPPILAVANAVMKDAPGQFDKTLRAYRQETGGKPQVLRVYDGRGQAEEIIRRIDQLHACGIKFRDMAVLYRSHFHSIEIQMALAKAGMPHCITSGVGVFEQIHAKDILAYLRIVIDASDELSFLRIVQLLPGVGEKTARSLWEKLGRRFDGSRREDRDAVGRLLGAKARPVWPRIAKCLECAGDHLAENAIGEVVEDFTDLFYENYLHLKWEEADAEDRLADVREIAAQIADSGNPDDTGRQKLESFLNDVALMTNLDVRRNDPSADAIMLSTVHQAKGKEWPVVFLPWLSEGMFPSGKATEEGRCDEERRLFYVAVTRAKDYLVMMSPQIRKNPDGGMYPVTASPFLREMPRELIEVRRVASFDSGGYGYGGASRFGGNRRAFGRFA